MRLPDLRHEFLYALTNSAKATGLEFGGNASEVAQYAAERATHLASIYGQPGFDLALEAERDNVAMFAAVRLSQQADATDQRLMALFHGLLSIGVAAIVP